MTEPKRGWRRPTPHEVLTSSIFWVLVAFVGLAAVVVALVVQNNRINRADRVRTAHIAEVRSSAASQYQTCIKSTPLLRKVNEFVLGVEDFHRILLENAIAAHRATPPGSRVYAAQVASIARLRRAVALVSGLHFAVPTAVGCAAARDATLTALANDP